VTPKQKVARQKILTVAYNDYRKGLSLHAFFKVRNRETGEDLVQDTFAKTWKYLAKGGKIDLMKAFLYHILNDLCIDEYRKQKTSSLDTLLEKGFDPGTEDDSLVHLFNVLDGKAAVLLIGRLPEKYQKVMTMRYVDDMTIAEMSAITGQTKNAITVQSHRGLEKLKLLYEPEQKV
jgi:RNA polymerase sigma-70 factor (ECF subfamily)